MQVYQKLYEAPDPAPVLAAAFETASRAAELEAQNKKLSAELADYREEAASIKNQVSLGCSRRCACGCYTGTETNLCCMHVTVGALVKTVSRTS